VPFRDATVPGPQLLVGPADGARRVFRQRAHYAAGFFVGLHAHRGDETFEVREGTVRFTVGDERRQCGPGTVVIVPPGVMHGFVAETDTVIEIFSEQAMGLYVLVHEPDGDERTEEVYMEGFPSSHAPPPGAGWTPRAHIRALYDTTRARL
jgi:quercetin dioxygenase-like cupin family protein